ncbi:MAG: diguanylate cyclase [Azoarcus sp.]|jgi:diguanylate cyclase (GGDEF)-like protein|nr:diguanylate cyclase [Azoarcus sp.]
MSETRNSILLVDDESANLLALREILGSGYAIRMARNGRQALDLVARKKPDLILLDVLMPEMDGFAALERLKADPGTKDIHVILVTGLTGEHDEERGFLLGAADYIRKPFNAAVVKMRVDAQIETIRQIRANEKLSRSDPLTGIANRRKFDERLTLEWRRAVRERTPLSFLMLDLDKFKTYNDTYGHPQGDELLRTAAAILAAAAQRPGDLAARLGGEEFGVLMPTTGLPNALSIAEKIRRQIEAARIPAANGEPTSATVSIGAVSIVPSVKDAPEDFIARADANLYKAKERGRNRVYAGGGQ